MESVPLIPKPKVLPNLDALPLIRELFQDEFSAHVPSKKLSQNLIKSLQSEKHNIEDEKTYRSFNYFEDFLKRKDNLIDFAENVFEAYSNHEKCLESIRDAEKNILKAHIRYLKRQSEFLKNPTIQDFLCLKRRPLLEALDANYVNKYKLLQGDAGLPPKHEAKSDFRVIGFKMRRKKLMKNSQESLGYLEKTAISLPCEKPLLKKKVQRLKPVKKFKQRPQDLTTEVKPQEILKAEPTVLFFTDYKVGDLYVAEIELQNVFTKGMQFQIKPMALGSPFKLIINERSSTKIFPGIITKITVEFCPKILENFLEDIQISLDNGDKFLIPLVAYLEPPVLKTHPNLDEWTRSVKEKIESSYIECGTSFTGDTKVTKIRFRCHRGCGEFFIMSSENWNRSFVNAVTTDNLLEIPPFRVYPVFFKVEKNEVIDLYVEFSPKTSGTQVENIIIACDNGEIRSLDLLADAVGWHSYFFTFQDSLLKMLPVDQDDDIKVKHYLDFEDIPPTGTLEKVFRVSNNSSMPFEFQWKIREANIPNGGDKYLKLSRQQVKIDPENGTFEPNSIWEFLVTISFNNAEIGNYRMVLSLYVLNLPYQCIEEDNTVIQPTGLVRNLYSQSLYGEEECTIPTPELLSLQGTYESLQESIKSYVECQTKAQAFPKQDFCRTMCIPNPGLCAKPLKKSKTYFNIGDNIEDEGLNCVCRLKPMEVGSVSESCASNTKDKINESPIQRSEIIWDFVDILVDEIELWAEVTSTRVTLRPNVIELGSTLKIDEFPETRFVEIINHNRSSITCKWLKASDFKLQEKPPSVENPAKNSFSLLFDNKLTAKNKGKFKKPKDLMNKNKREFCTTESKFNQATLQNSGKFVFNENLDFCKITAEPQDFSVLGRSEFTCKITISALRPGEFKEELWLYVCDGDFKLQLLILGTIQKNNFTVFPELLDFGVLRQGTRYIRNYNIVNDFDFPLFWNINQYKFDFKEERFFSHFEFVDEGCVKRKEGILTEKGSSSTEPYYMDARVPGIKCSLLEVQAHGNFLENFANQYILILGDVKHPVLSLSSPRFENAILAPSGMMYVGQTVSTKVTLTNNGSVETFFSWGHPFGCHCRKIKVEFSPKYCRLEKKKKITINVSLTPLDEGIINHCYVPCFFCRSSEPLILSIVGIAENLHVTFEVIDYPKQTHADTSNFFKTPNHHTVLRVPWPFKTYNLTLDQKFISEEDILSMKCYCSEVEEANLCSGFLKSETDLISTEKNTSQEINGERGKKIRSFLLEKSSMNSFEEFKESTPSGSFITEKKSFERYCVQKYVSNQSSMETLQFFKSQLEFREVPFRTPISRQFVIRNETSIPTSFQIKVVNFGPCENILLEKITNIKNRVFRHTTDEYKMRLPKNQPLILIVEPSKGELLGFDAVPINVYAYGNTWGEYRDFLNCQIKGVEAFFLKIFVQIIGHPINFPMFDNTIATKPVLRFQSISCNSDVDVKKIKVVNRSAIPITVSWMVFLISPLMQDEELEGSFNLCVESNANLDSNHSGEDSTKSTKLYIPKNASESVSTFRNMLEIKDFSQNSAASDFLAKTESTSENKEDPDCGESNKTLPTLFPSDEAHGNVQQLPFIGRIDNQVFQVDPKEMEFEAFEEKKIKFSFNPTALSIKAQVKKFEGVLTACVKLKPEDEKRHGFYYRPCGINFVSEILDLNAVVETPLISFEILKGDLKFLVDSNLIIKSPTKNYSVSRKFLIKNKSQHSIALKIEIIPGVIFHVKNISTIDKIYQKYNSDNHQVKVDPGQFFQNIRRESPSDHFNLQIELECFISYKNVIYAYEQLKASRRKDKFACSSEETKAKFSKENGDCDKEKPFREPWKEYFNNTLYKKAENKTDSSKLGHRDSLQINQNRMSSKSDNSICYDMSIEKGHFAEMEGEYLELPFIEEHPYKPKFLQHETIIEEEINFVQEELITQILVAELHLSFPIIKISPKYLDFGNVYIDETAVRYCSLINLTGFPTDFKVKTKSNANIFGAKPLIGSLPSTNYNSDIGETITVKFKPPEPGYFKEIFLIYCNLDMEFDYYELFVSGIGTWNEKYKIPKLEIYTKLQGPYAYLQN